MSKKKERGSNAKEATAGGDVGEHGRDEPVLLNAQVTMATTTIVKAIVRYMTANRFDFFAYFGPRK